MNFANMLEWSIRTHRDRVAVVRDETEFTFGEVGEHAQRIANSLRDLGVGKGDRVLVATGNDVTYFEIELAVAMLGAVKVPALTTCTESEFAAFSDAVEPAAAFASRAALTSMRAGMRRAGASASMVVVGDDLATEPGEFAYDDLLAAGSMARIDVDITSEDLYAVRFTGGTTGIPKGVMMDHRCMAEIMEVMLVNWEIRPDDVCLHIHPATHASGFLGYGHFLRGANNAFVQEFGITADRFFEAVARYGVTSVFTVPTLLTMLLDSPNLPTANVSSLRQFVYGGAPIAHSRLVQALGAFGPVFIQLYGSSEAPFIAATLAREEHVFEGTEPPRRLQSAGRPALGIELNVRREDRTNCGPEEVGEIAVRSDSLMTGFWRNPELTAKRKVDGWVYTGDLGFLDHDGYLYLVDRKEDMIISGGFNVWPNEVENVISQHPAIKQAAVFGIRDEHWGEAVTAVVVPHAGAEVDGEELRAFIGQHVVSYKVPKRVIFRSDPLPTSAVGKTLRRVLRDEVSEQLGRARAPRVAAADNRSSPVT